MSQDPPNGPVWVVPFEAVRASLTTYGATTFAELVARQIKFAPHARVELAASGFVAVVAYSNGDASQHRAVFPLNWAPVENRLAPTGRQKVEEDGL